MRILFYCFRVKTNFETNLIVLIKNTERIIKNACSLVSLNSPIKKVEIKYEIKVAKAAPLIP